MCQCNCGHYTFKVEDKKKEEPTVTLEEIMILLIQLSKRVDNLEFNECHCGGH